MQTANILTVLYLALNIGILIKNIRTRFSCAKLQNINYICKKLLYVFDKNLFGEIG